MKKEYSVNESGSAGLKLIIALVVLFLIGHAGYSAIPVLYQAADIRSEIHTAVVQGSALPGTAGNPVDVTKLRLKNYLMKNGMSEAVVDVKSEGGMMKGTVKYTKQIDVLPFGLYKYQYVFDHTDSPTGFLMKQ